MSAVISGAGVVSSLGRGFAALKRSLREGSRPLVPAPTSWALPRPQWLGWVPGGDRDVEALAWLACEEALDNVSAADRRQLHLIVAGTTGGIRTTETAFLDEPFGGLAGLTASERAHHSVWALAQTLSERLHLTTPPQTVMSACASASTALVLARRRVLQGRAERVLVVAAETLCRLTATGFASLGAVDTQMTRPFHRERAGLSLGEGAAAFVVERDARHVRLRLLGDALVSEAHHATQPDPSGAGVARVLRQALRSANVEPGAVDVVSAHGTGTVQNDVLETRVLGEVLGPQVPVTAQKAQFGHALGAGPGLELAALMVMFDTQTIFPTVGVDAASLDPACSGVSHVFGEPRPARLRVALKNSLAFGGHNACLVVGQ